MSFPVRNTWQDLNLASRTLGFFNFDVHLRTLGYTGSFNDNFYKFLGDAGYTGALPDRWKQWRDDPAGADILGGGAAFDGNVFDVTLFGSGDEAPLLEEDTNTSVQAPGTGYTVPFAVPELFIDPSTATGVYQFEVKVTAQPSPTETSVGLGDAGYDSPGFPGRNLLGKSLSYQSSGDVFWQLDGTLQSDAAPNNFGNLIFVQVVLDCPAQEVRFYREGVLQSTVSIAGVPFATGLRPVVGMAPNNRVHVEVDGFFAFPIAGATKWTEDLTVGTEFNNLIWNKYTQNGSNTGYTVSGTNQETWTNSANTRSYFTSNGLSLPQTGEGIYQCEWLFSGGTTASSLGFCDDHDGLESAFRIGLSSTENSGTLTQGGGFIAALENGGLINTGGHGTAWGINDYIQMVLDQPAQELRWYQNGTLVRTLDISGETMKGGIRPAAYSSGAMTTTLNVSGSFNNAIAGASPWVDGTI